MDPASGRRRERLGRPPRRRPPCPADPPRSSRITRHPAASSRAAHARRRARSAGPRSGTRPRTRRSAAASGHAQVDPPEPPVRPRRRRTEVPARGSPAPAHTRPAPMTPVGSRCARPRARRHDGTASGAPPADQAVAHQECWREATLPISRLSAIAVHHADSCRGASPAMRTDPRRSGPAPCDGGAVIALAPGHIRDGQRTLGGL